MSRGFKTTDGHTKLEPEQDLQENAAEDDVSHAGKKMLKKELAPNGSG